uniref:Rhomboid domain-containing protein n=1 Tax=Rhabditophanes sp. KR3021 TaxID=114890 RepID=A0AC35TWW9_9BILA
MTQRQNTRNRTTQMGVLLLAQQLFAAGPIPPITFAFIMAQIGIYTGFIPPLDPFFTRDFCLLPRAIIKNKQWYRLLIPVFMHADDWHLYYNMISLLYKGKTLERHLGSSKFVSIILALVILTPLIHLIIAVGLDKLMAMPRFLNECTVGFSGKYISKPEII